LHGTTTGEYLFLTAGVCETMKQLGLPWTKLKGVTRGWAPSMTAKTTNLMGTFRPETDKQNPGILHGTSMSHH
jgi:hypothetical protein